MRFTRNGLSANTANHTQVIALHCSGGSPSGWTELASNLPARCTISCPEHVSTENISTSVQPYSLQDDAEAVLTLIDQQNAPVYLVGHSFGGALAVCVASQRPGKVIGATLFEPCLFGLLDSSPGTKESAALAEILAVANEVSGNLKRENPGEAVRHFVNYWNDGDAWSLMHPKAKQNLIEWAPNALRQFDALFQYSPESLPDIPIQLVTGEYVLKPPQAIAEKLLRELPDVKRRIQPGAGHMGPLTHAAPFAAMVRGHIEDITTATRVSNRFDCSRYATTQAAIAA